MTIKYNGFYSAGQAFETGESRDVTLAGEALDKAIAFAGETVVYTATVKDDLAAALPATFVANLLINGTEIISNQILDAVVYDPVAFLLTLSWLVPAAVGSFSVKLSWDEQII